MSNFLDPVSTYMTSPVHTVSVNATLSEASKEMMELRLSSLAVVDDGRLVGVISYTDLLRAGRQPGGHLPGNPVTNLVLPTTPVAEVMTVNLISVQVETSLRDAARRMVEHKIHRVYVLEGDTVVGVVSTRDLMHAVRDGNLKVPILELMTSPVITAGAAESLSAVTEKLDKANISGIVITDENDWPIGMFSQREALESADHPTDAPIESVMSSSFLALPMTVAMHRAAAQAAATRVRRVVVVEVDSITGILTGLDFARAVAR